MELEYQWVLGRFECLEREVYSYPEMILSFCEETLLGKMQVFKRWIRHIAESIAWPWRSRHSGSLCWVEQERLELLLSLKTCLFRFSIDLASTLVEWASLFSEEFSFFGINLSFAVLSVSLRTYYHSLLMPVVSSAICQQDLGPVDSDDWTYWSQSSHFLMKTMT